MRIIAAFLLALPASALLYACGGETDDSEWSYRDDWGYNSRYTGNAAEARPEGTNIVQEIAVPMIEAINFGSGMYNSAVKIMMPNLRDDNISVWQGRTDNGTCYPVRDNGTLDYRIWPAGQAEVTSDLIFSHYCVDSNLAYNNMTIINDNATMTSKNSSSALAGRTEESLLKADNLSVSIVREPSSLSDNYTFRGYVNKYKETQANGTVSSDNVTIAADMQEKDTVYRFDFETITKPSYKKTITFYYPSYGYVTADISGISDKVPDGAVIVMKYKDSGYNDGSCTFTPAEIGTNDFDCKSK